MEDLHEATPEIRLEKQIEECRKVLEHNPDGPARERIRELRREHYQRTGTSGEAPFS